MSLLQSVDSVIGATGPGSIDWGAVEAAAQSAVPAGSLAVTSAERSAYHNAVTGACDRIRSTTELAIDPPSSIQLFDRHHWVSANTDTMNAILEPYVESQSSLPGLTRRLNTATMAGMLAFLSKRVIGQYDPALFTDEGPQLFVVQPNFEHIQQELSIDQASFRQWVILHEVAHVAEFQTAPWLQAHLETAIRSFLSAVQTGSVDRDQLREIERLMTVIEGYASWLTEAASDDDGTIRSAITHRRHNRGLIQELVYRLSGLSRKIRQYERGHSFFETIAMKRDPTATGAVWESPERLPTSTELDTPERWLDRVNP